ncbi:MAG: single-stranded DNA-binding protein [Dehalococcoidia bacterium]|nr:single-stranded DNA-binding protein [Dehalococcoidia bacterium]
MERDPEDHPRPSERSELIASQERALTVAVVMLLDALDRCGGHEAGCPECGPARALAFETLASSPGLTTAQERKPERLQIRGRAGAAPAFGSTRRGAAVARFPLAVHDQTGTTTWHTVVAFGDRAERLRGAVGRGDALEVVGYFHERAVRARGGRPRQVRELYAAAVRPLV